MRALLRVRWCIRWRGWQPEGNSAQLRPLLLLSRTQTVLTADFPGTSLRSSDVAALAAAEALFLRLLGCAQSQQQLLTLLKLLSHAWDSGAAFTASQQVLNFNIQQTQQMVRPLPTGQA